MTSRGGEKGAMGAHTSDEGEEAVAEEGVLEAGHGRRHRVHELRWEVACRPDGGGGVEAGPLTSPGGDKLGHASGSTPLVVCK